MLVFRGSSLLLFALHVWAESDQKPIANAHPSNEYYARFGPQIDHPFSGPLSFAHLPYAKCLEEYRQSDDTDGHIFDIAVLGMPYDSKYP